MDQASQDSDRRVVRDARITLGESGMPHGPLARALAAHGQPVTSVHPRGLGIVSVQHDRVVSMATTGEARAGHTSTVRARFALGISASLLVVMLGITVIGGDDPVHSAHPVPAAREDAAIVTPAPSLPDPNPDTASVARAATGPAHPSHRRRAPHDRQSRRIASTGTHAVAGARQAAAPVSRPSPPSIRTPVRRPVPKPPTQQQATPQHQQAIELVPVH